jgi:hypothetical protein
MAIQKTRQTGDIDEPLSQAILELQQIALGMFLIWDALGDDYHDQEIVEKTVLANWARRNKIGRKTALEALIVTKERFRDQPWAHYIHCRDFKAEGWANMLQFNPKGNQDALDQLIPIMESRPFKEVPE